MNILEAPGARAEKGHGLLGDVGRVVVQHYADDGILRVVGIDLLEQSDELNAAVTVLDVGKDVPGMQVDAGHDRHSAVANVLIVTPDTGRLARHRWQIGCGQSDGLNTGLFIDADGVDGVGPRIVNSAFGVERNVPIDHQVGIAQHHLA
jgi:hypothetical protein